MITCTPGPGATARRVLLCSIIVVAAALSASSASAATGSPRVVGGSSTTIDHVPWQVALVVANSELCGGSILDARHVLTAAHCVVPKGSATPRKPSDITVLAGFSDIKQYVPGQAPPAGSQVAAVSALRVHPYYVASAHIDDVAVLTLAKALNLSGPNAKAIALAPAGAGSAPGSTVSVSGYGQQDESRPSDGKLYVTTMTAISDDACRDHLSGNSAVVVCAQSATSAPCHGDSGGPVTTTTAPIVQVALVSYGPDAGCGQGPSGMTDVTAPEVRAFLDGASAIPMAPRASTAGEIRTVMPPVVGSPVTCQPGTWSGTPAFNYAFQTDDAAPAPLQAGPSDVYVPQARDIGRPVVCVFQASNAGGTSTARTGTTPPIARDGVAPQSAITFVRCRGRTCRLTLRAVDPNSQGALRVAVNARYRVCRRGRRCSRTRSFNVAQISATTFRATGTRLPYRRLQLRLAVADAAGNPARARYRHATPHRARKHRGRGRR